MNQFGLNQQSNDFTTQQSERQFGQQRELIGIQTDANSRLQNENAALELTRLREQGTINERLQSMDQNFRALESLRDRDAREVLQSREFTQAQTLLVSEYANRAGLSRQEADQEVARLNAAHENTLKEITAQSEAQQRVELGPRLQAQYLSGVTDRMRAASEEIQTIYTTQGLSAAQQNTAVAAANARMTSDLTTMQAYYAQSPLWDVNWGAASGAAAPIPAPGAASPGLPPAPAAVGMVQTPTYPLIDYTNYNTRGGRVQYPT
jgi:hypothetical protein